MKQAPLLPQSQFELVKDFAMKFGLTYEGPPRPLPPDLSKFRRAFLEEEFVEYCESAYEDNLEGQLDALVDLVYVALGTAALHGFDFDEAFRRVHAANMQKVRAERTDQSKRGSTFDVVKPNGWKVPYLGDLV